MSAPLPPDSDPNCDIAGGGKFCHLGGEVHSSPPFFATGNTGLEFHSGNPARRNPFFKKNISRDSSAPPRAPAF